MKKWFSGCSSFTNTFCNRNSCRCSLFPVITNLVRFACFQACVSIPCSARPFPTAFGVCCSDSPFVNPLKYEFIGGYFSCFSSELNKKGLDDIVYHVHILDLVLPELMSCAVAIESCALMLR